MLIVTHRGRSKLPPGVDRTRLEVNPLKSTKFVVYETFFLNEEILALSNFFIETSTEIYS